jgi:hypothetical protein
VWSAVRALQDSESLMRRMAQEHTRAGKNHEAGEAQAHARRYARMALEIERLVDER